MMRAWRRLATAGAIFVAVAVAAVIPSASGAQQRETDALSDREVARLLEEASALETRGELLAAEERLRIVLDDDPVTAAAVTALERVLRGLGEAEEILPVIEAYLEGRPAEARIRRLHLQVLARLDSVSALEAAAREWIDLRPNDEEPYRQAVLRLGDAVGPDAAIEVIGEARDRFGSPRTMALTAGDLLHRAGRPDEAGREWGTAIVADPAAVPGVLRRIDRLAGDGHRVVNAILDVLENEASSPTMLRRAARIALEGGLSERATELADRGVEEVDPRTRRGFLVELAQRAEQRGNGPVALWAFARLRDESEDPEERRALDERLAELATGAGEVNRALDARGRIARSEPPGSPVRRRALAAMIELEMDAGDPVTVADRFQDFRAEFPEAAELDGLAARLAQRLAEEGRTARAAEILREVEGPQSALERGYLRLRAGEIDEAIAELDRAVGGLGPDEATRVLELVVLLERVEPRAAELAARAVVLERGGDASRAVEVVREGLSDVSLDDRPAVLALAAGIASRQGRQDEAADLRAHLVREFPDSPQFPEAALRLARFRATQEADREEAMDLLETLIVTRPESAVTPDARRELERLRAEIPGANR